MTRKLLVCVGACGMSAAPVSAATLCVSPAGGSCRTTIQAAVDAAGSMDVVAVRAGVYFENVTIPAGKDGLQVVGASKLTTIVDPDLPNVGAGFTVQSHGVRVRNLTIRNGQSSGIFIAADGAVVQGVRMLGLRGVGVLSMAGTIGAQVLGNEIRAAGLGGIYLGGSDNAVVSGNVVSQAPFGIVVFGSNVQVKSNSVASVLQNGVQAFGDLATVTSNTIENVAQAPAVGLAVSGKDPVVVSNRLISAGPGWIDCVGCTAGSFATNSSVGSSDLGFHVSQQGVGLLVKRNSVSNTVRAAYQLQGNDIRASLNVAADTTPAGPCFEIVGGFTGSFLDSNAATRCGGAGFLVNADNVTLDRNTATSPNVSGFLVAAGAVSLPPSGTTLTKNKAALANGQGFAVRGATGTVLTGNAGLKNRLDFCDEGSGTNTSGGNAFASTSTTCDILR